MFILLISVVSLMGVSPEIYNEAEVLFLKGMKETNGEEAYSFFKEVVDRFPGSEFYDDAFIKVIEYVYSKGLYKKTIAYTHRMLRECSGSPFIEECIYFQICSFNTLGLKDSVAYYLTLYEEKFPGVMIGFEDFEVRGRYVLVEEGGVAGSRYAEGGNVPPQLTSVSSGRRSFFLQVGAFSELNNALSLRERLISLGYHALVHRKKVDAKVFYVVKIGSFSSRREAREFGRKFKRDTGMGYLVVED